MTREELKQAALSLPYEPGVYLMKDASDTVIYVGKAKKLKNRVSQYFQDTASHNAKTRRMVSLVDHFETIRAASEFEALVLECSLIKHYMPKYNILLKDDKGYPYLRLDLREPYPRITLANRVKDSKGGRARAASSRAGREAEMDEEPVTPENRPASTPVARRVDVKVTPPADPYYDSSLDTSTTEDDIDAILREIHQRRSGE